MYGRSSGETSALAEKPQGSAGRAHFGASCPHRTSTGAMRGGANRAAQPSGGAYRLNPASWHDASLNKARWSPMPNDRMTVNGIELEVLRRGAGTPLLLLPGWDPAPPPARCPA